MMISKSVYINVSIFLLWVVSLTFSFMGPVSGRNGWFYEITPDWSIWIVGDYEIGNSVEASNSGTFCIRMWTISPTTQKEYLGTIIDGIEEYNYNNEWILARTDKEWFWVNVLTDSIESSNKEAFQKEAPQDVVSLSKKMKIPKPAYRYKTRILLLSLTVALIVRFCMYLRCRNRKCCLTQKTIRQPN